MSNDSRAQVGRDTRFAFELLAEQGLIAIGVVRAGLLVETTPKLDAMFALDGAHARPRPRLIELVADVDRERIGTELARAETVATAGSAVTLCFDALRADGSVFEAELVGTTGAAPGGAALIVLVTDVTARRRAEKQLSYLAFLDPLTGLANRALFLDRLRDTLVAARRDRRVSAVLMCDLDGFKQINDRHGHDAGDAVLRAVARRLESAVRDSDTVARLGGDEFAVVLAKVASREQVAIVTERMVRAFDEPILVGDVPCKVGISIGIATHPEDASEVDAMITRADAAMYESKRAGKNRYTYAVPSNAPQVEAPKIPFMRWNPAHEVGVGVIDAQHRGLVDLVNRLGDDLKAGRDHDAILATLSSLVTFTVRHFATEERLMAEHAGWPLAAQHAQEHRKLVDDVTSLTVHVDVKSMALTMRFLQEWLLQHIAAMDRPLAGWLREHGVG
jgi:diguanylate cyclase (GGDEF)-like protein/hemerythrin-like metal-binding protein